MDLFGLLFADLGDAVEDESCRNAVGNAVKGCPKCKIPFVPSRAKSPVKILPAPNLITASFDSNKAACPDTASEVGVVRLPINEAAPGFPLPQNVLPVAFGT